MEIVDHDRLINRHFPGSNALALRNNRQVILESANKLSYDDNRKGLTRRLDYSYGIRAVFLQRSIWQI